jgi:hypothetical protein
MPSNEDVRLLRDVVRERFLYGASNAIVLALEGMKWLLGETDDTTIDRAFLEQELQAWIDYRREEQEAYDRRTS